MKLKNIEAVNPFWGHGRCTALRRCYTTPDNTVIENQVWLYPDQVTTWLYKDGGHRVQKPGISHIIRNL